MYILDTDHMSLLDRGGDQAFNLAQRIANIYPVVVAASIVGYEEQMRGWMAIAANATDRRQLLRAYDRLYHNLRTYGDIPVVPFADTAADQLEVLQKAKIRIGTMDLKIAAICLANDAILLTRNTSDFGKVPGLRTEDWS